MVKGLLKTLVIVALCAGILGGAGYFAYDLYFKPRMEAREETAKGPAPPPPDPGLPAFEKCTKLKKDGHLVEARTAFEQFLDNYPNSTKIEDAKDALGEINTDLFFSATPSPDKEQYVVQRGDALAKIEKKLKTTAELIMRSNNLDDPTKLQIGQVLLVSHPDFSMIINRKIKSITLLNNGKFFKRYKVKSWAAPAPKNSAPIDAKVTEKIAWKNGQRVAFSTKDFAGSARWIQLSAAGYTIYTEPLEQEAGTANKPPGGIALAAEDAEELSTLLNRGVPVRIE